MCALACTARGCVVTCRRTADFCPTAAAGPPPPHTHPVAPSRQAKPGEHAGLFLSPYGIAQALGMLLNGVEPGGESFCQLQVPQLGRCRNLGEGVGKGRWAVKTQRCTAGCAHA